MHFFATGSILDPSQMARLQDEEDTPPTSRQFTMPSSPTVTPSSPHRSTGPSVRHSPSPTPTATRSLSTTAPLSAVLPLGVELVFVDAPSLSRGDFGWWHDGFRGWERTRDWVLDLAAEHFDGVFGFSQGAALTGLLAALQQIDPTTSLRFEFAVMFSGFTSFKPQHAALFEQTIALPSLHVMGASDGIVAMRDSLRLAARFEEPVIVRHSGGHVIPADQAIASRIADFVAGRGVVSAAVGGHRV
jgi:Serine hydrolase (FSH1)